MPSPAIPLKEFDLEMASTRKLLERVPGDKGAWKPHQKSFALGHLAQLTAMIPGWIAATLRENRIDLARQPGYSLESTHTLVSVFDKNAADARAALESLTGATLNETWTLAHGDRVLMALPRGEAVRQHLSHLVHHRGQLTVYLRLVDVPLPSVYGPTADERW